MQDFIKFEQALADAVTSLDSADNLLNDLETKLADISANLKAGDWQGSAYEKCVGIHDMIIEYNTRLKPSCGEVKIYCNELLCDINDFYSNSTNVRKINSV